MHEADSWGTEFIFILPPNNPALFQAYCCFFGRSSENDIVLNIEYTRIDNSNAAKKKDKFRFNSYLCYDFDHLAMNDTIEGLHMLGNDRIHVTSSDKISVLCYINDLKTLVDAFLVHPVGMGGDYYAFSLPGRSTMTLYFLPLGATNETISQSHCVHNVSITVKQNNKLETIKQNMKAGSLWQYTAPIEQTVSVWIRDRLNNPITKGRMMVIASIRNVSVSGVKRIGFGCFMPTPMIVDQCAKLINPAYHPAQKKFAENLLLTAPSPRCPQDTINITNIMTEQSKSLLMKWNKGAEEINTRDKIFKEIFSITSEITMMNIVNYGDSKGIYIHEIPEFSQWITDDTLSINLPSGFKGVAHILVANGEKPPYDIVEQEMRINGSGMRRFSIEQFNRYLPIVIGEVNGNFIGYVAAINLRSIPSPIFAKPDTTTVLLTTTIMTTTEEGCLVDFTEAKPSTSMVSKQLKIQNAATQNASISILLSNNLFAIYLCLMIYSEIEQ
ncbi:unnamed protein product [Cercopithifilaria johnstoni]|uniref:Uncharacterized protein n=1 Tax=Cercopithifilaria johnstoni TaxID=2874296 RepID=A0A8J2M7C6_9BILA|nr:unnamed protein product [Cercopithifilaria johnstoni]